MVGSSILPVLGDRVKSDEKSDTAKFLKEQLQRDRSGLSDADETSRGRA
jgi:hypothetical protein